MGKEKTQEQIEAELKKAARAKRKRELRKSEVDRIIAWFMKTTKVSKKSPHYFVSKRKIAGVLGYDLNSLQGYRLTTLRINQARRILKSHGYIVYNEPKAGYRIASTALECEKEFLKAFSKASCLLLTTLNLSRRYNAIMDRNGEPIPKELLLDHDFYQAFDVITEQAQHMLSFVEKNRPVGYFSAHTGEDIEDMLGRDKDLVDARIEGFPFSDINIRFEDEQTPN